MAGYTEGDKARFWGKVEKGEKCWLWKASKCDRGYGRIGMPTEKGYRPVLAHRVSWEIANGPVPEGLWVLHDCPDGDNPSCVNPAHLFLGTDADNMQDAARKGRLATGDRNWAHLHPELHHNKRKSRCPQGHEYDETNTVHEAGKRRCRTCRNAQRARRRQCHSVH